MSIGPRISDLVYLTATVHGKIEARLNKTRQGGEAVFTRQANDLLHEGNSAMGWFGAKRNWGMLVLAVWLILMGAVPLLKIELSYMGTILNVLAIAAGILLLLGR